MDSDDFSGGHNSCRASLKPCWPNSLLANVQQRWLERNFKALPGGGGWWRRGWGSRAPPGHSWVGCRCASWFWGRWCNGCKSPCTTHWPSPTPGGGCAAPGSPSPSTQGHRVKINILPQNLTGNWSLQQNEINFLSQHTKKINILAQNPSQSPSLCISAFLSLAHQS